jgi:DNA segregation ATPase FtsK/SpoIIIE, S-DNA-T family
MPRGRKKKFKLSRIIPTDTLKSLVAVFLIVLSGLGLISFFAPDYFLNAKILGVMRGLFGNASILAPFILFLFALFLIDSLKLSIKNPRILAGMTGLLISFSSLSHIFISENDALRRAAEGAGGGIIGYYISSLLKGSLSVYGGTLVLLSAVVVSILLVFGLSFDQFFTFLSDLAKSFKEKGYADGLKKIFKRGGIDENGEGISVSSGTEVLKGHPDADLEDSQFNTAQQKVEPSIEIIPSMSEPMSAVVKPEGNGNEVATLVPNLPYSDRVWENPPIDLLMDAPDGPVDRGNIPEREKAILNTLSSFGIKVGVHDTKYGPSVTQFQLDTETGTRISKISSLQYDIAMATASPTGSVRIEAPIPGTSLIGIEVPNNTPQMVSFKSLLTSDAMKSVKSKLAVVLGKDVGGQVRVYDIAKMPHLLVAGATGSGKSVFLHSVIFRYCLGLLPLKLSSS